MMKTFEPEKVRQFFFLTLLTGIGVVLFINLKDFLPSFLGAFTFYVLLRKYMKFLLKKNWKPAAAAVILMLISFLMILLPLILLVNTISKKVGYVIIHSEEVTNSLIVQLRNIETRIGSHFLDEGYLRSLSGLAFKQLPLILSTTFNYLVVLAIMYFILYYMLTSCYKMEKWFGDVLPLRKDNTEHIEYQVNKLVITNALGIPLIALLQGVAGLIIYLILGVKEPFLWFTITSIVCLLPVIGSPLAYIPLALILIANGETGKAVILLLYGILVIGTIDNILRIWLQKLIGDVHPLITIFGVFVGIPLFGFMGLIFGPLLIALFILLMRIYRVEFIVPGEKLVD